MTTFTVTGVSVGKAGKYASTALRQEVINITAIQSRVKSVDIRNLKTWKTRAPWKREALGRG